MRALAVVLLMLTALSSATAGESPSYRKARAFVNDAPMRLAAFTAGHTNYHSTACPFTGAAAMSPPIDDGCSQAPVCTSAGQAKGLCFQDQTAFNWTTDTTIFSAPVTLVSNLHADSTTSHIKHNVAGVDFPVGVDMSKWPFCNAIGDATKPCSTELDGVTSTGFIDASLYDWVHDPAGVGCSLTSRGSSFPPVNNSTNSSALGFVPAYSIFCNAGTINAGNVLNLNGFDWTPVVSGHHICVGIEVDAKGGTDGAAGGTINVLYNKIFWSGDVSCQSMANNNNMQPINLRVPHGQPWTIKVKYNSHNMNALTSYHTTDNNSFMGLGGGMVKMGDTRRSVGGFPNLFEEHVEYNYFNQVEGRVITPSLACNGFTFNYNVVRDGWFNAGGTHGEPYLMVVTDNGEVCATQSTPPYMDLAYYNNINNTIWQSYGHTSFLDSTFNLDTGMSDCLLVTAGLGTNCYINILSSETSLNTIVLNGVDRSSFYYITMGVTPLALPNHAKATFTKGAGADFAANDIITIGNNTYRAENPLLAAGDFLTGGTFATSASHLAGCINANTTTANCVAQGTASNVTASAGSITITFTATVIGTAGNAYTATASTAVGTMGGSGAMSGAQDQSVSYTPQINDILTMVPIGSTATAIASAGGCSVPQTVFVSKITSGIITAVKPADQGRCAGSPGAQPYANFTLTCLWCGSTSPTTGVATGLSLSSANGNAIYITGAGVGLQYPSNHAATFANLQSNHVRNNAISVIGGILPGSPAFRQSGNPVWMDLIGFQLSCLNPPVQPAGSPPPAPPSTAPKLSPYWNLGNSLISNVNPTSAGSNVVSGNFYIDAASNGFNANANFNTTTATPAGFVINGAGC